MIEWVTGAVPASYDEVKRAVSTAVEEGRLRPGDKLPTVRALAAEFALAPNTVARAYRELEALGVVDTRGRAGTFVSADVDGRAARAAAADYLTRAAALGLTSTQAADLVVELAEQL